MSTRRPVDRSAADSRRPARPPTQPAAVDAPTDRPSRLLRFPEVSRRVGVGKVTLWRWRRQGRFPEPARIGPNTVAWLESVIDAWIAARTYDRLIEIGRDDGRPVGDGRAVDN